MTHRSKILELAPTHYFPLDQLNTISDYNGDVYSGAIVDVSGNVVLESSFRQLLGKPATVNIFGGSVVPNQKLSNAMLIGTQIDTPYTIVHSNFGQSVNTRPTPQNTSLSFNFSVNESDMLTYSLTNMRKVQVYIGGDYYGDADIYGNSIVFRSPLIGFDQVYFFEFKDSVTGNVLYEYTLECVFSGTPTLTSEVDFSAGVMYTDGLDNTIEIKNVYYDTHSGRKYLTKPQGTVNAMLQPYFVFEHRLDVITPTSQVVVNEANTTKTDLITIGGVTLSILRQRISQNSVLTYLCIDNVFFSAFEVNTQIKCRIETEKPYCAVICFDVDNGGTTDAANVSVYLNGISVYNSQLLLSRVTPDVNTTFFSIGNTYNVVSDRVTLLNGFMSLQNVAIYDRVLTSLEALTLHQSSYNFIEYIIDELTPEHLYEFNSVSDMQRSTVSSAVYTSNSFTLQQARAVYGYNFNGVTYTGSGSVICTSGNVETSSNFSVVILCNIQRGTGTLISQQSRGLLMQGYTLKYTRTHLVLQVGTTVVQQPLSIPLNTNMLLVLRKSAQTYTVTVYNSNGQVIGEVVFNNLPQTLNYQTDCYLMSSHNSNETNNQFTLYGAYFYQYDVGTRVYDAFVNTQYFTTNGLITLRNLPVPSTLRVYDNVSGVLLDTLHTTQDGTFTFRNLYQREVSITVYEENTKIFGVISPVVTGE